MYTRERENKDSIKTEGISKTLYTNLTSRMPQFPLAFPSVHTASHEFVHHFLNSLCIVMSGIITLQPNVLISLLLKCKTLGLTHRVVHQFISVDHLNATEEDLWQLSILVKRLVEVRGGRHLAIFWAYSAGLEKVTRFLFWCGFKCMTWTVNA